MTIEIRTSNRADPRPKKLLVEDAPPAVSDWRHLAACRNTDADAFFPIGNTGPALLMIEDAKAVCRDCPVRDNCLNWAIEHGEDAGVWGGMSEDERRALKRSTARAGQRERERARKQAAA